MHLSARNWIWRWGVLCVDRKDEGLEEAKLENFDYQVAVIIGGIGGSLFHQQTLKDRPGLRRA